MLVVSTKSFFYAINNDFRKILVGPNQIFATIVVRKMELCCNQIEWKEI